MADFWLLFRMKLGRWMLHTSMDVMPRCELRDDLRFAIVTAYHLNIEKDGGDHG